MQVQFAQSHGRHRAAMNLAYRTSTQAQVRPSCSLPSSPADKVVKNCFSNKFFTIGKKRLRKKEKRREMKALHSWIFIDLIISHGFYFDGDCLFFPLQVGVDFWRSGRCSCSWRYRLPTFPPAPQQTHSGAPGFSLHQCYILPSLCLAATGSRGVYSRSLCLGR